MSRYSICKQTLLTNIEYAQKNNINIIICLFDNTVRLYTNIIITDESKIKINNNFKKSYELYDNLSYLDIINKINNTLPEGGTDFLIPFELLSLINEINTNSEIFFLSDGYNNVKFTEQNLNFLSKFKNRITTMGIGSKFNFDNETLSKISKNNSTIEGQNADIIQQELLAQMTELSLKEIIDNWMDVEVILLVEDINTINVGSMMNITNITEEEYNSTNFVSQGNLHQNLIISENNGNIMISKKNLLNDHNIVTEQLIFIVDQSGSMDELANNEDKTDKIDEKSNITDDIKYIKYTMNLPDMKSYQRIIFSILDKTKFKGQISWKNSDNQIQKVVLNDLTKLQPVKLEDENIIKTIELANMIGHYINISQISIKDDQIGYFRKINQICKKNSTFFDSINEKIADYSLIEILFYNKKHGMKLFNSTLNNYEKNMNNLLQMASAGGGYKMLAATSTMSAVRSMTPSQQYHGENYIVSNRDISMCTICFDEIREYVFSCGHCYACKSCAEKILLVNNLVDEEVYTQLEFDDVHVKAKLNNKCSYCKSDITWIRKITMTEDQKNKDHYYKCISENCYNIATIVSKCDININIHDDSGYHLTYCDKCYKNVKNQFKKTRVSKPCFCGKEILTIVEKVYFI